ncbi:MAG: hypothetical protein R3A52_28895 [Polyangiales bacterium]
MSFTGFEKRWIEAILSTFVSDAAGDGALAVREGEVDWAGSATKMTDAACGKGRFGFRAALWIVSLAPLFVIGRPALFASLEADDRRRVLAAVVKSPYLLFRGLGVFLKLAASMALFGVASVRAQTNYERTKSWPTAPVKRGALPVVREAA